MSNQSCVDALQLKRLAQQLAEFLRLRTLPIGMQLFHNAEQMQRIEGLRHPKQGRRFSTCQLVTQARVAGLTLGIRHENVLPNSNCGGVVGLNTPSEEYLSGRKMNGVWFNNIEAARAHQEQMPRVEPGQYHGLVVSPLRMGRLDPPDICLFYGTPGQMILFINGLQHETYRRYEFSITGESACADSWGRALATRQTSLSIPCYAERRYGGVADDELLMALPPEDLACGVRGLERLYQVGLRYPIAPYSAVADPAEGLSASYGTHNR